MRAALGGAKTKFQASLRDAIAPCDFPGAEAPGYCQVPLRGKRSLVNPSHSGRFGHFSDAHKIKLAAKPSYLIT